MTQINLMPWRQARDEQHQQEFLIGIGVAALIAAGSMFGYQTYLDNQIAEQKDQLKLVNAKEAELQVIIKKIKYIEEKEALITQKIDVIYELQTLRPEMVHFFYEIAKATPNGVVLNSFKQQNKEVTLSGKTESNTRVSDLMKNVEASEWLIDPKLNFIKGQRNKESSWSDFTLRTKQKVSNANKDEEE